MKYGFNFITQALSGHGRGGYIGHFLFKIQESRKTTEILKSISTKEFLFEWQGLDRQLMNLVDGCVLGRS